MIVDTTSAPAPSAEPVALRLAGRNPALCATPAESLVVVVAPANGRFHPSRTDGTVAAGDIVGHLAVGQGRRVAVPSPADLEIHGLLTRAGQLIMTGQALLWGRLSEYGPA